MQNDASVKTSSRSSLVEDDFVAPCWAIVCLCVSGWEMSSWRCIKAEHGDEWDCISTPPDSIWCSLLSSCSVCVEMWPAVMQADDCLCSWATERGFNQKAGWSQNVCLFVYCKNKHASWFLATIELFLYKGCHVCSVSPQLLDELLERFVHTFMHHRPQLKLYISRFSEKLQQLWDWLTLNWT